MYSPAALGLEGFLAARERTKMQVNNVESFKSKMEEFVKDENSKNLVFTEDLKNMLHISDKPDVELLSQMIKKFCSQSQETRFGNFVFGPPIMRLLHHLNDTETALKLFKDTSLKGFFDQLVTYQLILDLLFNNKMYQEVLDTYDVTRARQVQGGRFAKHAVVLALAACYKLNTPASFEYANTLWKDATGSGHIPMRRASTFFATLALNQGQPQIALEVIGNVRQQNYVTIKTIKALAFAELKRFDDVLFILKAVLETDNPMANKQTFPSTAIELLKQQLEGNTNKDLQADFQKVVGFLTKHGHLSDSYLDDILCAEIQMTVQVGCTSARTSTKSLIILRYFPARQRSLQTRLR